jgi:2-dehydro-3-deoxygalactonokinase
MRGEKESVGNSCRQLTNRFRARNSFLASIRARGYFSRVPAPREFLSCDWGTSSFRLRRVVDGKVIAEIREAVGVRSIYEKALETKADRAALFEAFLDAKLQEISGANVPLIISGMASSTIGWHELPYAKVPFALDGTCLRVEQIEWSGHARTFLISGAATDDDVMRGEETQIIGVMRAARAEKWAGDCELVLPGTHSKHVRIQNRSVVSCRTFMTGELFDVLGRHSILRPSVNVDAPIADVAAFEGGVQRASEAGLPASLFSVRARAVLNGLSASHNTSYLSGLLIGAELRELTACSPIILAGAGIFAELYLTALNRMNLACVQLSREEVDQATVDAHGLILAQL